MTFCTRCGKQIEAGQVCGCSSEKKNMLFCTRCGKQIKDGQVCGCSSNAEATKTAAGAAPSINRNGASRFLESLKDRIGIGDPERNATDCYERGQRIVPDNIKPNEGEIPVRQYNIAVLRNLLKFERAEGRMQITNKRLIFRAPGRSIGGRTTLQHEYAVDEIAGIEAIRNYWFSILHFLGGLIFLSLTILTGFFVTATASNYGSYTLAFVVGILLWGFGLALFFMIRKKFLSKLLAMGVSLGSICAICHAYRLYGFFKADLLGGTTEALWMFYFAEPFRVLIMPFQLSMPIFTNFILSLHNPVTILVFLTFFITLFVWFLFFMRPNLVIKIKNKMGIGQGPIDISRGKKIFFHQIGGTPFSEVMPTDESEKAIREMGAIISDIQKLGDFGVNKWIEK